MIAKRSARAPSHGSGSSNPKSARLGIVWTTLVLPSTNAFHFGRRVSSMPSRHSDEDGQQHRYAHQPQVFGGQGCHFAFMGEQEVQRISRAFDGEKSRGCAMVPRFACLPERIHQQASRSVTMLPWR